MKIPKRFLFVGGTFLLSLLLYIDRACISVAKSDVADSLDLSDTQMGVVMSAFALGYALFQTPGGMIADKFGPRKTLAMVVSFWSIFTAATGAAFGYISMLIARFLFGAGEAGAFPGMARAVFSWIPTKERGLVTGINFSGSRIGGAFAFPAMTWLIVSFGWRMSFFILGVIGVVWALAWWFLFKDDPTEIKSMDDEELEYILKNRQDQDLKAKPIPFFTIIRSTNMKLMMVQYFCSNITFFFCLTWLFPYLKETYNLTMESAALYTMAPLIGGAIGNWFSGILGDKIYASGHWKRSRLVPAITGFLLAATGLVLSVHMDSAVGAIAMLTIAIFGADMTLSPSWSFCVDIGKESSGAVSGTMNMAGNVGSFITALAFPTLMGWTGSSLPFFYIAAGLNLLAVCLWMFAKPDKPIVA